MLAVSQPPVPAAAVVRQMSGSLSEDDAFAVYGGCSPDAAAHTDGPTLFDLVAEARSALERRVAGGRFSVGVDASEGGKTLLVERLGGGTFGEVYLGVTDAGERVAVKVELTVHDARGSSALRGGGCLLHEGDVYRKLVGCAGVPTVRWFGMHGSDYSALVMDLLGPTLYGVWSSLGQRFSMKTLLMVVDQTLETIADVHARGFIHRDISPSNFMLGGAEAGSRVHLIDFGQAKKSAGGRLVLAGRGQRLSVCRPVVGTPRFASVFAHAGVEPAFRDDLEALGYMWVYLARGRLPWQGIRDFAGPAKIARIGQLKVETPLEALCDGLPEEFAGYLAYARALRPQDVPDYAGLRRMFRDVGGRMGIEYDWKFDWIGGGSTVGGLEATEKRESGAGHSDQPSYTENLAAPETKSSS